MKVKCDFCGTKYKTEETNNSCPSCGKTYKDWASSSGADVSGSIPPYGGAPTNNLPVTPAAIPPSTPPTLGYNSGSVQTYDNVRPQAAQMPQTSSRPPSINSYKTYDIPKTKPSVVVATVSLLMVVLFAIVALLVYLFGGESTNKAGSNIEKDAIIAKNSEKSGKYSITGEKRSVKDLYNKMYLPTERTEDGFRESLDLIFYDYAKGEIEDRDTMSDFIFQWAYDYGEDINYKIIEAVAAEYDEESFAAEAYLQLYNETGDKEHLYQADFICPPYVYFEGLDTFSAFEDLLDKMGEEVTWLEIGKINTILVSESYGTVFAVADESGKFESDVTGYYSDFYPLHGLFGAQIVKIESETEKWSLPFYATKLMWLEFANTNIEMSMDQLDYFKELENIIPSEASLVDMPDVSNKVVTMDYSATESDLNAMPANVEEIYLDNLNEDIKDLYFLQSYSNLKKLTINGGSITDFTAILTSTGLTHINITNTNIKDINFLSIPAELEYLSLIQNSDLTTIKGIGMHTTLKGLCIEGDKEGYEEIASLVNLEDLTIKYPRNLEPLSKLSSLTHLTLFGLEGLENIASIGGLTNLKGLIIESGTTTATTAYFNLEPIRTLTGLEDLRISNAHIYGVSDGLFSLPNLKSLEITGSRVNLAGGSLNGMTSLEQLCISESDFLYDVSVETDGIITSIDYNSYTAEEVGGKLQGLENLTDLYMIGINLEKLDFVEHFTNLKTLDITDNNVTELTPLNDLEKLETVYAGRNPLKPGEESANYNFKLIYK